MSNPATAAPTHGTSQGQRVPALDLLRFLAAVSVMLYHYVSHRPQMDGSRTLGAVLTQHGYLGVDVFFMISGFVILWSAIGRNGGGFLRARILRLYPEFWIAVLISATAFTLVPGGFPGPENAYAVAANFTMLPGYLRAEFVDGVYWTLAVELKFYAFVWLLVVTRQIGRLEYVLYGWLAALAVASFADVGGIVRSLLIYPHGAHFAAGGLFFLVFSSGWTAPRAVALAAALALCAHSSLAQMKGFMDADLVTLPNQSVTVAIMVAAFAIFAMLPRLQKANWPSWVALAGALTYPLYLTHNVGKEIFLIGPWAENLGAARHLVAIAFSLVLAWIVMWLADKSVKPALKWMLDGIGLRGGSRQRPSMQTPRAE